MRLPFLLGRFLSRIDEGRAIEHRFRKTEIGRCQPGTPGLETSTSEGKFFRFFFAPFPASWDHQIRGTDFPFVLLSAATGRTRNQSFKRVTLPKNLDFTAAGEP